MQRQSILFGVIGITIGVLLAFAFIPKNNLATQSKSMDSGHSMSMEDMVQTLNGKTGDDFDKAFITSMIEHHQGAIDMAKEAKKNAKHEEVKRMADDIIRTQTHEIDQMMQWQSDWGYHMEH